MPGENPELSEVAGLRLPMLQDKVLAGAQLDRRLAQGLEIQQ
jgi:hypothetical protein